MRHGLPRCRHLALRIGISLPPELTSVVRLVKGALQDGIIEEGAAERDPYGEPFDAITEQGPWNDILHHGFHCTACRQRFTLTCDTYPGSGGAWAMA